MAPAPQSLDGAKASAEADRIREILKAHTADSTDFERMGIVGTLLGLLIGDLTYPQDPRMMVISTAGIIARAADLSQARLFAETLPPGHA